MGDKFNIEDVALDFEDENATKKKERLKHPLAAFFHLFFRSVALVAYLLCGLLSDSFITSFVVIVLLLSFDFWTVKNVTGRLLVGLRWWNYVDEDGQSQWVFEARKKRKGQSRNTSSAESKIFWLGLIVSPIIWIFLLVASLFSLKLKWMLVVIVGLTLNFANLFGYIKCKKDAGKQVTSLAGSFFGKQLFSQVMKRQDQVDS